MMTVRDLIDELMKYNTDLPVVVNFETKKMFKQRDIETVLLVKDLEAKVTAVSIELFNNETSITKREYFDSQAFWRNIVVRRDLDKGV